MEQEVESLFAPLFKEFDIFFKKDEKDIGCLDERQHKKMMAIYNDVATLYMQVLNGECEQLPPKNEMANSSAVELNESLISRGSMRRMKVPELF